MNKKRPRPKKAQIVVRLNVRDILFEDENYIAINKKSGWPVHATLDKSRSNLFDSLKSFIKQRDKLVTDPYLALHHRLDVETSGIVIFAKTKAANPILSEVFSKHQCKKIYIARCDGHPKEDFGELSHFLKKEKINRFEKMISVTSGGQKAILNYKVLKKNKTQTLVEFDLITGRMHQIRVQASLAGFALSGDKLYGNESSKDDLISLHCRRLSFFDSLSKKEIQIEAEAPFLLTGNSTSKSDKKVYIAFNKPYNVLCQFTKQTDDELCLGDFNLPEGVYPAGRLDKDSEGLLILTNDGEMSDKLASAKNEKEKTYHVQVEGVPKLSDLEKLKKGIKIQDYITRPAKVLILSNYQIEERNPPIRERKNIETTWLEIIITEGKNRQVRKMTAAIGFPTLRLVRVKISDISLENIEIGSYKYINID